MRSNEGQAATPVALIAIIAIQKTTDRKPDPAITAFYRRCLEAGEEVDRRRASRMEADTEAERPTRGSDAARDRHEEGPRTLS